LQYNKQLIELFIKSENSLKHSAELGPILSFD